MIALILSALLFGLVHCGSKLFLDGGIPLLPFCLLYVGIRLCFQIPIVIRKQHWKVRKASLLYWLAAIGVVGAGLQFLEFKGISDALPVGLVSFLVYTHPVWTLGFSRIINKEKVTRSSLFKISLAVIGMFFLTRVSISGGFELIHLAAPIGAGVCIALWIVLSNKCQKEGIGSGSISFYYDLFSLIALGLLFLSKQNMVHEAVLSLEYISSGYNFLLMAFYSIAIGYLPNILFYKASKTVSAVTCGLVLLLEPVISSLVAYFAWDQALGTSFVFGAMLILCSNLDFKILSRSFLNFSSKLRPTPSIKAISMILLFFASSSFALAKTKVLLLEIVDSNPTNYTVSAEIEELKVGASVAEKEFFQKNPKCRNKVELSRNIKYGSEEDLFKSAKQAAHSKEFETLIGFSRSSFARIAAKAAEGTSVQLMSLGASTEELSKLHPSSYSICAPQFTQIEAVLEDFSKQKCTPENTALVFNTENPLSYSLRKQYALRGYKNVFRKEEVAQKLDSKFRCLLLGLNISKARPILSELISGPWNGTIYGSGDWNFYAKEITSLLNINTKITIKAPTGWIPEKSSLSQTLQKEFEGKVTTPIGPAVAYAFDTVTVALGLACQGKEISSLRSADGFKSLRLMRNYSGIASSGNFLSKMHLKEFKP